MQIEPGILHTPSAPRYDDERECDESPVFFCERCRKELDVDRVDDDGLHFHAGCLAAIVEEERMDELLALAVKWEAEAADRATCCDEARDPFFKGQFWGEAKRLQDAARDLRAVVETMKRAA